MIATRVAADLSVQVSRDNLNEVTPLGACFRKSRYKGSLEVL